MNHQRVSCFLTTLRQNGKVSIQTLVKIVNEWRVLDDSVTSCISRDTVRKAHSYPFTVYHELNDSIHIELCRMAMSKQRTFHDLLYLREQTSSHVGDEELQQAVKEAQPFFASLDSLPIYNKGGKQGGTEALPAVPAKIRQARHSRQGRPARFHQGRAFVFQILPAIPAGFC